MPLPRSSAVSSLPLVGEGCSACGFPIRRLPGVSAVLHSPSSPTAPPSCAELPVVRVGALGVPGMTLLGGRRLRRPRTQGRGETVER